MSWGFPAYVPVAQKREQARKRMDKLRKKGMTIQPVEIDGRKIATTFWGKSWCTHIESFSDFSNRLPRGRTYARNGSVCHLDIAEGCITAMVAGSDIYHVKVSVNVIATTRWNKIKKACRGEINSLIDLLSGKLSAAVMDIVCDPDQGLFPRQSAIKLECDCPDWADMCKHIAAVLYGVGARLDSEPDQLFALRGVNHLDMIDVSQSINDITSQQTGQSQRLSSDELSGVFGFDFDDASAPQDPDPAESSNKGKIPKKIKIPKVITGKSVARLRDEMGLTKTALARALGMSVTTIYKWESYGRKKIAASQVSKEKIRQLWNELT